MAKAKKQDSKQYVVVETSFIDNRIVQPGELVWYSGNAGPNLRLADEKDARSEESDATDLV